MKPLVRLTVILLALAFLAAPALAVEKNGMLMTVTKKTVKRGTDKETGGTRNTQSLDLQVRNTSIRDIPAGEVKWTILVKRSAGGDWYQYSGTEVLPALRNAGRTDMMIGEAKSGRHRTDYADYRDRVEYEVIISHGGKETIRTSSVVRFDDLKALAITRERLAGDDGSSALKPPILTVQNDVALRATKRALRDPDERAAASAEGRVPKTAALGLEIRNASLKPMPAGEVRWTLIYYRPADEGWAKFTGTAAVDALAVDATTKVFIDEPPGVFPKGDRPDSVHFEYEVTIHHGDLETVRTNSSEKYAGIAAKAAAIGGSATAAAAAGKTMPPDPATPVRKDFDFFNLGKKAKQPAAQ